MNESSRSGNKYMEKALPLLKEIVDKNGVKYLQEEPYAVYKSLESQETDPRVCRVVLVSLLAGAAENAEEMDEKELSGFIQKECFLKKAAADQVSQMWIALFGEQNLEEWAKNDGQGLRDFCSREWEYSWDGEATWYSGGVHTDCWCSGTVEIEVSDEELVRKETAGLLKKNPFLPAEKIFEHYKKILKKVLDEELEDYVTCDDYYPPVMEDYGGNFEGTVEEFCKKYGFDLVNCECEGDMSDFEPNGRGYW